MHGQRSDDGNALLLPAGQGRRIGICFIFQPDFVQKRKGSGLRGDLQRLSSGGQGKNNTLLLAEGVGQACSEIVPPYLAPVGHSQRDGRKGDVLQHGLVRKEIELLENHADFSPCEVDVHVPVGQILPLEVD